MVLKGNTQIYYPDGEANAPVCNSKDVMCTIGSQQNAVEFMQASSRERRHGLCSSRSFNPLQDPMHLYKYRNLVWSDKNGENKARDLIVRSRIWSAHPFDLNDPHDVSFKVHNNNDIETRKQWIKSNEALLAGVSPAKRLQLKKRLERQQMTPDMGSDFRKSVADNMGIFSASVCPRNILMWTHYADNHKGFCLQYATYEDEIFMLAKQVVYDDQYPSMIVPANPENKDQYYLHKSQDWKYEREWRIILPLNKCLIQLRPRAVSGIIFGAKVDVATVDNVMGMLKERQNLGMPHINVYKANLNKWCYGINISKFK